MHIFRCPHFRIWNKVKSLMFFVTRFRGQKIRRREFFFHSCNLNCRSTSVFFYMGVIFWGPIVNFRWSNRYKNNYAAVVHIKQVTQRYHKWPGKQITYLAKGWTKISIQGPCSYGFYDSVLKIWYDNSAKKAVHIPMTNILPSNTSNPYIQNLTRCSSHL